MNIISISAEVAPYSKTGGLGDVCAALPVALAKRGHRVMTVAPRYKNYADAWDTGVRISLDGHEISYFHAVVKGVDRVFVDHPSLRRGGIYGDENGSYGDNWFRFSLLCQGAILAAMRLPLQGKIYSNGNDDQTAFLFHDWHASLVPAYLNTVRRWGFFKNSGSSLVIHNLAHQGVHHRNLFGKLSLPSDLYPCLDMDGHLNLLKGGMALADKIITVSPSYAKEICTTEFGMGLEGILQKRRENLYGILNGIDTDAWNPQTDKIIEARYSSSDMRGKEVCKRALQREVGLPIDPNAPIFGFISRLDHQKGVDLIEQVLPYLLSQGAQVILLGTGSANLEKFVAQSNRHTQVAGLVKFSNELAHKITAGSDFLLMPSRFEPCGLTQQHALAYGTIPIAHATGGLKDTVFSLNPWKKIGNGWVFSPLTARSFQQALRWGISTYKKAPKDFRAMQIRAMDQNRSWDIAALQYEKVMKLSILDRMKQRR